MKQLGCGVQLLDAVTSHPVVVAGREVPHLGAWQEPGAPGRVWLSVPGRMLDVPEDEAARIIQFVADAIAVGMGYVNHPGADREPVLRHPFPQVHVIDSVTTDADVLKALDPDSD